jgi:hypothetical protein
MHSSTRSSSIGSLAVCYQCSYQSDTPGSSSCPRCSFPLILQRDATPSGGTRIEDILKRQSVRAGAPPLPGVDAEKRQAQLLAEARQRRRAARLARGTELPEVSVMPMEEPSSSTLRVMMVCASAVAAGVLAAMINSGL